MRSNFSLRFRDPRQRFLRERARNSERQRTVEKSAALWCLRRFRAYSRAELMSRSHSEESGPRFAMNERSRYSCTVEAGGASQNASERHRKMFLGSLTQLVECLLCKQDVRSSILLGSTTESLPLIASGRLSDCSGVLALGASPRQREVESTGDPFPGTLRQSFVGVEVRAQVRDVLLKAVLGPPIDPRGEAPREYVARDGHRGRGTRGGVKYPRERAFSGGDHLRSELQNSASSGSRLHYLRALSGAEDPPLLRPRQRREFPERRHSGSMARKRVSSQERNEAEVPHPHARQRKEVVQAE